MDQRLSGMSFTVQDLAEQREFDLRVMFDTAIRGDAIFIHGRGDLYVPMLKKATWLYFRGYAKKIIINGLSRAQCLELNVCYLGHEEWTRKLTSFGVRSDSIVLLPPSNHTGFESVNLINLAQNNNWQRLIILGIPYHIQRCMLQMVGCLKDAGVEMDISTDCAKEPINLDEPFTRMVLGGSCEYGPRSAYVASEVYRSILYAMPENVGFRNATYAEGNEYFKVRNKRRAFVASALEKI